MRMNRLMLLSVVWLCSSCMAGGPSVELNGERFSVELAETQEKQALGLMFRDSLPDDHGMIFIFPREAMRAFWMKNCRVPLDIVWLDERLRIVALLEDVAPCPDAGPCQTHVPDAAGRYVLEFAAGTVRAEKLARGQSVVILSDPPLR